ALYSQDESTILDFSEFAAVGGEPANSREVWTASRALSSSVSSAISQLAPRLRRSSTEKLNSHKKVIMLQNFLRGRRNLLRLDRRIAEKVVVAPQCGITLCVVSEKISLFRCDIARSQRQVRRICVDCTILHPQFFECNRTEFDQ